MNNCRKCGKPIIWIRMGSGKSMPCDPDPVPYWEKPKAPGKVITPNGMTISCELEGDLQTATGVGFIPHWSTCPHYKDFKKGGSEHGQTATD